MSDTRLSIFQIVSGFSRLTEINLVEQFVDGVREFAASIVIGSNIIQKQTSNT